MKHFSRIALVLFAFSASLTAFSQNAETPKQEKKPTVTTSTNEQPLRKITNNRGLDIKINLDEEALEASIESAIERAMKSVEVSLE